MRRDITVSIDARGIVIYSKSGNRVAKWDGTLAVAAKISAGDYKWIKADVERMERGGLVRTSGETGNLMENGR